MYAQNYSLGNNKVSEYKQVPRKKTNFENSFAECYSK